MEENDSVLVITHEPNWLLDSYWSASTGKNMRTLICDFLKGRCKIRLAGDLHHYMRHSAAASEKSALVRHLIVNGAGGAFLHPTHPFNKFKEYYGSFYDCKAAYPTFAESRKVLFYCCLTFLQVTTLFLKFFCNKDLIIFSDCLGEHPEIPEEKLAI